MTLTADGYAGSTGGGAGTAARTALRLRCLRTTDAALRCLVALSLRLGSSLHVLRVGVGNAVEGVFFLRVTKDVLTEGFKLLLNTFLLGRELRGVTIAELQERLALGVVGLIDLTTIPVERKEVVHRHRGSIVEVRRHHRLTIKEWLQIAILHPEQGVLSCLTAEIVFTHHDRTKSHHLDMESSIGLIVVSTLLEVVFRHL